MISGVSTGSLIGFALANGMTAKEIRELYEKFIPEIFGRKAGFLRSLFGPYYNIDSLESVIKDYFGDKKISDTKTNFMCYANKINDPEIEPVFWKSWRIKENIEAYKALTASCAAPMYFKPYRIKNDILIDGGMITNSPNVISIVEAIKMGSNLKDIKMLNIAFNTLNTINDKKDLMGLIRVASRVTDISIWGTEKIEKHQASNLLDPHNFTSVCPVIKQSMDTKDFKYMNEVIDNTWFERKHALTFIVDQ